MKGLAEPGVSEVRAPAGDRDAGRAASLRTSPLDLPWGDGGADAIAPLVAGHRRTPLWCSTHSSRRAPHGWIAVSRP